jgi:hypothetical protein
MSALQVECGQGEPLLQIIIYLSTMINFSSTKHFDVKT